MTKRPWHGGGSGSGDLHGLAGPNGDFAGMEGDLAGQNGDLDGPNGNLAGDLADLDGENVFRWPGPTVISTLAVSVDFSQSKVKIISLEGKSMIASSKGIVKMDP